jgi:hypothetical protein
MVSARSNATEFLALQLSNGPMDIKALKRKAEVEGITWDELKRVKDELGIVFLKKNGCRVWKLPTSESIKR